MQFRALIFCCTAFVACGTLYAGGDDDYYVDQQMTTQEDNAAAMQAFEFANTLLDYIKPKLQKFVKEMFHNKTELQYGSHNATCTLGLTSCQVHLNQVCLLNPPGEFRKEAKCILEIGNLFIQVGSLVSGGISALWKGLTGYDLGGKVKIDLVKLTNVTLSVQKYSIGTNFGTLLDQLSKDKKEEDTEQNKAEPEVKQKDGSPSYKVTGYVGIKDFNIAVRTWLVGSWLGDKHADEVRLFDEKGQCGKIADKAGLCANNVRDPDSYSLLGVVWALLKFIIAGDVSMISSSAL